MRKLLVIIVALSACSRSDIASDELAVLFVGNSLTYVGNLPAVFDAVVAANGRGSSSDMLVAAGATLTQRLEDGSFERAMNEGEYSIVVLQERGGDFLCGFGPQVCEDSRQSLGELASIARQREARAILMGTYQADPRASDAIVEAESEAASNQDMRYVSISDRFELAREAMPELRWYAADGAHPGNDLILMQALLLYEFIYEQPSAEVDVIVEAPIYSASAGLRPEARSATDPAPLEGTDFGEVYDAQKVGQLIELLGGP
jgi:hypothetical protein